MHRSRQLTARTRRSLLALSLVAGLVAIGACRSTTADTPKPLRLTSRPPEAEVVLETRGQVLITPCSFPRGFATTEAITIRKAGYQTFQGALRDIAQIATNHYEITLLPE